MRLSRFVFICAGIAIAAATAHAQQFRIEEVTSVAALPAGQPGAQAIAFSDHREDKATDPASGLTRFAEWAQAKPLQRQFLSLYPAYDEPTVTVGGRSRTKRLYVYVAEARFELKKPAQKIDAAHFANLSFLERMDPAIKHTVITADDAIPNKSPNASNRNPNRRWCEGSTLCIQSRYQLEGRIPAGIALVNKLKESGRKIADYIEFQSELRVVPAAEIDQGGLAKLTGIDTPVVGALEQNIFHVNQIMQFGKFFAVFQQHPSDANRTIATAFMVLGVDSDLFEKKREYAKVPVLRNLVPAQVLAGNSTFNSGNSISAGLPKYARNRLQAVASLFEGE